MSEFFNKLNGGTARSRLSALSALVEECPRKCVRENDANNHIHTIYSFSPYSPTKAAYMAYLAGLTSAGIMDHDSISGAKEFIEACKILGLGSTCGVEVRAHFNKRHWGKINHPDQEDCIYMAAHGIPHQNIDAFNNYLDQFRKKRNERNAKMCELINAKFGKFGINLDFKADVYPLSMAIDGGSITERHLLFALAKKLEEKFGRGEKLLDFIKNTLGLEVSAKAEGFLSDDNNEHFLYDLLGVLKSDTAFFYINADEEMPDAEEFIKVAKSFGAIPAYAYLGDVGNSVTGDKRAQKFEDDFLDELIPALKDIGIEAIAYMPTRNTLDQLMRLRELCSKYDLFEISGEDVNSPRQSFECKALARPEFENLITSTWALIGHEALSTECGINQGMFSNETKSKFDQLSQRVEFFASVGRRSVVKS